MVSINAEFENKNHKCIMYKDRRTTDQQSRITLSGLYSWAVSSDIQRQMYHGPTLQSPTNQKEHYGVSWDETRFQNDKLSIMANKNEIAQASLLVS